MKAKKKYTHLFFDLDNTLWNFDVNSYHAMQASFSHYNLQTGKCNFDLFFTVFSENNKLLWDQYRQGTIQKKELIRLRFQQTFEALSITDVDAIEMNEHYLGEMPKQKKLMPGAKVLLDYLTSKGYALFIITNGFSQVQQKKMEAAGILKYFRKIFVSEAVKAPKPAKQIFEYALKSAHAPKAFSLMIGDDYHSDISGALNFGMDAVYLTHDINSLTSELFEKKQTRARLYQINELQELAQLV